MNIERSLVCLYNNLSLKRWGLHKHDSCLGNWKWSDKKYIFNVELSRFADKLLMKYEREE